MEAKVRAANRPSRLTRSAAHQTCARWVRVWVIGDDFSFKRCETLCKKLTDVAKANDTDGLAEDFYALERRTLPLCFTQGRISLRNLTRSRKQQGDCVLTSGVNIG